MIHYSDPTDVIHNYTNVTHVDECYHVPKNMVQILPTL
jgi:hypothetical protein